MKMEQSQAATYCALTLATAAGRTTHGMQRMEVDINRMITAEDALEFFEGADREAHQAIQTLILHHMTGAFRIKGGGKKAKFNMRGADATWQMAKTYFGEIAAGTGRFEMLPQDETRHVLRETGRILKEFAAQ